MKILERIRKLRKDTLAQMKYQFQQGDTSNTVRLAAVLERLEKAEDDALRIGVLLDDLENNADSPPSLQRDSTPLSYAPLADRGAVVGKQRGSQRRAAFLDKLKSLGIELSPHSGRTIYKTGGGKVVGIGYASERSPHRWFLGAPVGDYDALALLCERENGDVEEFLLPGELIGRHFGSLAIGRQLKFNVVEQDGSFQLLIPGGLKQDIEQFRGNYEILR